MAKRPKYPALTAPKNLGQCSLRQGLDRKLEEIQRSSLHELTTAAMASSITLSDSAGGSLESPLKLPPIQSERAPQALPRRALSMHKASSRPPPLALSTSLEPRPPGPLELRNILNHSEGAVNRQHDSGGTGFLQTVPKGTLSWSARITGQSTTTIDARLPSFVHPGNLASTSTGSPPPLKIVTDVSLLRAGDAPLAPPGEPNQRVPSPDSYPFPEPSHDRPSNHAAMVTPASYKTSPACHPTSTGEAPSSFLRHPLQRDQVLCRHSRRL